jgi:nucleotide-binding universal stress UspA family protein
MDAAELARISSALIKAIAEARTLAGTSGAGSEFREVARHAREMQDLFIDALLSKEPLATEYFRGIAESTGNAIDELEELAARADFEVR